MAQHTKLEPSRGKAAARVDAVLYQVGFGNQFQSEAVPGALPVGRNSPQRAPLGLYAEQISGTAFTAARHENRRTWTYRITEDDDEDENDSQRAKTQYCTGDGKFEKAQNCSEHHRGHRCTGGDRRAASLR